MADDRDVYDFRAWSEDLSAIFARSFAVRKAYLDERPLPEVRSAALAALDEGRLLVHYAGHGSGTGWAAGGLLDVGDVPSRAAHPRLPVVVSMNCLNGMYAYPAWESLGEVLVETPEKGAVAFWGSTALTDAASQRRMSLVLADALASGRARTLGEAVLESYRAMDGLGNYRDLLHSWVVLGDPELRLPR